MSTKPEYGKEYYDRYKKRVEKKIAFYIHLLIYLVVNAVLAVINMLTDPSNLWFLWSVGGWGIGLVLQAVNVFYMPGIESINARTIEQEIEREGRENND